MKEYCENSFANFASHNKYDLLSDPCNYESNFPSLPRQEPAVPNNCITRPSLIKKKTLSSNKNLISSSQPTRSSNYNEPSSSNIKKRKITLSSPSSPTTLNKFDSFNPNLSNTNNPFRFRARQPTFAYSRDHEVEAYAIDKNKISECLSVIVLEFLENIKSVSDCSNINLEAIKQKLRLVLEDTIFP